jgi:hypothetical protein
MILLQKSILASTNAEHGSIFTYQRSKGTVFTHSQSSNGHQSKRCGSLGTSSLPLGRRVGSVGQSEFADKKMQVPEIGGCLAFAELFRDW